MGKRTPAPPPAPDYAAANEAAINTDISTLPLRNAINAASQLGTSYTDPNTNKTYDFTGLGTADINAADMLKQLELAPKATEGLLDLQKKYGGEFAQSARDQLKITDPTGFALRDSLGDRLGSGYKSIEELIAAQGGGGPTGNYEAYVRNNPDLLANWTNNASKNTQMTLAEYGKDHYDRAGRTEGRELPMTEARVGADGLPNYESYQGDGPTLERMGSGPSLAGITAPNTLNSVADAASMSRVGGGPTMAGVNGISLADRGAQAAGRGELERQIFDELAMAGRSDPALQRAAEQAARARGSASGNILGDSSALQESLAVQLAQRQLDTQRRNDAMGLLSSGQGTSDTANRLALAQQQSDMATSGFNNANAQQQYRNQLDSTSFNNSALQQDYNNQLNRIGFNNDAITQDLANRSAATGFNNANAQQEFSNRGMTTQFNNDTANQAFQNAMNAIGQRNQATQNMFGAQQGQQQARMGARQQDLANMQSFLGLQPVVSQGTQLSGLQQQAAPFAPGGGYSAFGTNPNAGQQGAEWAGQLYGAQNQFTAGIAQANAAKSAGAMGAGGALAGAAIIAI